MKKMDDDFDQLESEIDPPVVTTKPTRERKQHVISISTTNTAYRSGKPAISLKEPFSDGGRACNACGAIMSHDECLGFWDTSNTRFTIVGYHCKKCNDRWVSEKHRKEEKRSTNKYHTRSFWERAIQRT